MPGNPDGAPSMSSLSEPGDRAPSAKAQALFEASFDVWATSKQEAEAQLALVAYIAELEADRDRLTNAVRWALGEDGDFVATPNDLQALLASGREALRRSGEKVPLARLYFWRSDLRARAFPAKAAVAVSTPND